MSELDGDISYQCWICPHCFDDHWMHKICDERRAFEGAWKRESGSL